MLLINYNKLNFESKSQPLKKIASQFFLSRELYTNIQNNLFTLLVIAQNYQYLNKHKTKKVLKNQDLQNKVENIGFEPMTPCLPGKYSSQLS